MIFPSCELRSRNPAPLSLGKRVDRIPRPCRISHASMIPLWAISTCSGPPSVRTLDPREPSTLGKPGGPAGFEPQSQSAEKVRNRAANESGLPVRRTQRRSDLAWDVTWGCSGSGRNCMHETGSRKASRKAAACLGPRDGRDTEGQNRGEGDATATRLFAASGTQRRHFFIAAARAGKSSRSGGSPGRV